MQKNNQAALLIESLQSFNSAQLTNEANTFLSNVISNQSFDKDDSDHTDLIDSVLEEALYLAEADGADLDLDTIDACEIADSRVSVYCCDTMEWFSYFDNIYKVEKHIADHGLSESNGDISLHQTIRAAQVSDYSSLTYQIIAELESYIADFDFTLGSMSDSEITHL